MCTPGARGRTWSRKGALGLVDTDAPTLTIRVFNGVGISGGAVKVELKGARQRRLLALLAIRAGTVADVDWLAEYLWTDEDRPDATTPAVRTAVYRLRGALPEAARAGRDATRGLPPGCSS